jgi:ribosomal protein S16
MAQSNKSRVVIWTIVGLLVVTAVVFLIVGKKGVGAEKPFTVEEVGKFTRLMETRIGKVEANAAEERGMYGPEAQEAFDQIDMQLAASRDWLQKMQSTTDQVELLAQKDSVQDTYHNAKRLLKEMK